jgi:glutathione S-transferase
MMKLRWAAASPFVRKVTVTAIETGLDARIERIVTDQHAIDSDLVDDNPLGKIPALILDDGSVITDSPVICAYLDSLSTGPRIIPTDGSARWHSLSLEALADGMAESAIAVQREYGRPEEIQYQPVMDRQWEKFERTMGWINDNPDELEGPLHIGQIAVACAISWVELRLSDRLGDWKSRWPALGAWYDKFCEIPSMQATAPR